MRLNHEETKRIAEERGTTLTAVLERAGVSRTAYYSLRRRENILPRTIRALALELGIDPERLLQKTPTALTYERRLKRAREICDRSPGIDFHNVWHTLTLLELPPVERLRRSLRRGRA
jgi:transcriptional regulator with XRE-family HTH domain